MYVEVTHVVIVAAGLLESVGHGEPPRSWVFLTVLILKEKRGFFNPLHKINTLIFLNKKLQHYKIIRISVMHEVAKVHCLKLAVEYYRTTQAEKQEADVIKSVQGVGHV